MLGLFYQYLLHNGKMILPGLGAVVLERYPAEIDIAEHLVLPPSYRFRWNRESITPPRHFFLWVSQQLGIQEEEAVMQVNDYVSEIKREINTGREIQWAGVGIIRRGADSAVEFEPEKRTFLFEESIPAEKVVHDKPRHTILVGEEEKSIEQINEILLFPEKKNVFTSFKAAVILLILSLLFITWYFYQNHGLTMESVSGKTKITPAAESSSYKQMQ